MARKPFKGSTVDNVLTHGVGALNIDATRIECEPRMVLTRKEGHNATLTFDGSKESEHKDTSDAYEMVEHNGRFPSNVIGEIPEYQKYFYCPKVSRAERHTGFEKLPEPEKFNNPGEMRNHPLWDPSIGTNSHRLMKKIREHQGNLDHIPTNSDGMYDNHGTGKMYSIGTDMKTTKGNLDHIPTAPGSGLNQMYGPGQGAAHKRPAVGNNHPTVKPVELMKYLIKLVTPAGGHVLDPFNGSGSTGMAAVELGYEYTGCELDPNYVAIAERRIQGWYERTRPDNNFNDLFDII